MSVSWSNRLSPVKTILNTELTGHCLGSGVALGIVWKRESCCLYWKTNNGFSFAQPAAYSHIRTEIFWLLVVDMISLVNEPTSHLLLYERHKRNYVTYYLNCCFNHTQAGCQSLFLLLFFINVLQCFVEIRPDTPVFKFNQGRKINTLCYGKKVDMFQKEACHVFIMH